MTAKEYLNQIRGYEISINALEREIQRLEDDLIRISGIDYSRPRVDSSAQTDAVSAAAMDEIDAVKQRRIDLINREQRARNRIIDQIRGMKHELFKVILLDRYVYMLSFDAIAKNHHYSLDYIIHAHGWALQEFEQLYKDDIK